MRTVEHLLAQPGWPAPKRNLRIVDLGCGDGRLIEVLAKRICGADITLVDPEEDLLIEAGGRLLSSHSAASVTFIHAQAEEPRIRSVLHFADVVLAVHLLYLMPQETVARFIETLSPGIPHYFVLDDPASLFSSLWSRTAPHFHERVKSAHRLLGSLPSKEYNVRRTTFDSSLVNPKKLAENVRTNVMSLLCYASYPGLDAKVRRWVDRLVKDRVRDDRILCRCACYEVIRTP